jgi:hypothetical protein
VNGTLCRTGHCLEPGGPRGVSGRRCEATPHHTLTGSGVSRTFLRPRYRPAGRRGAVTPRGASGEAVVKKRQSRIDSSAGQEPPATAGGLPWHYRGGVPSIRDHRPPDGVPGTCRHNTRRETIRQAIEPTPSAQEPILRRTVSLIGLSTRRTFSARIAWIDGNDGYGRGVSPVLDEATRLSEGPVSVPYPMAPANRGPLADTAQGAVSYGTGKRSGPWRPESRNGG